MKSVYGLINIFVILLTVVFCFVQYNDLGSIFYNQNVLSLIILGIIVLSVHTIKAFRLYLALYGSDLSVSKYIKIYCKVTPVSIILPFKTGEIFRIYCYGYAIKDFMKAFATILLDRFMDTAALITVLFFLSVLFYGGNFSNLFFLLVAFLFCIILFFFTFAGIYRFWNKKILLSKATENNLYTLKILKRLNKLYNEISNVLKGRGTIMYFLSLLAWSIEISNIIYLSKFINKNGAGYSVIKYLNSAISSTQTNEFSQFIVISLVALLGFYIIIKLKGENKCKQ